MSERFGSGPALDENFDLTIDSTGDLQSAEGVDELEKDLSVRLSIFLEPMIGQQPTPNLRTKVSARTRSIAQSDPRVANVPRDSIDVTFSGRQSQTIEVSFTVMTIESGSYDFIVEVTD